MGYNNFGKKLRHITLALSYLLSILHNQSFGLCHQRNSGLCTMTCVTGIIWTLILFGIHLIDSLGKRILESHSECAELNEMKAKIAEK